TYASTTVTTPAPAPVVAYYNEPPAEVFASGPLPASINMARINVGITYSDSGNLGDVIGVGTLVGGAFQVVFTLAPSAAVTNFSATLQYEDVAGDVGP